MAKFGLRALLMLSVTSPWLVAEGTAEAQAPAPSATAAFPSASAPPATSAPPTAPSAPSGAAAAPQPSAPPAAPVAPAPPPAYATPQPPYSAAPPSGYAYPSEPPPPPPQNPDQGFQRPDISLRLDPLNLLLEGRLGIEIESQVYEFLTVELVPVFVTTHSPPVLNYDTYERSSLRQSSNGIGAISGAAVDAGIWFGGKPFRGYVLRAGFTNYAYTYDSSYGSGGHDSVSHTDRQFFAMIGSQNRWGAFTIAGGFGLAYELNKQNRCLESQAGVVETPCDKDSLQIKISELGSAELHPFLYPFDLMARFSLGVVF